MADHEWIERLDANLERMHAHQERSEALMAENRDAFARLNSTLDDERVLIRDQLTRFDRIVEDRDRKLGAMLDRIVERHDRKLGDMLEKRDGEHSAFLDSLSQRLQADSSATRAEGEAARAAAVEARSEDYAVVQAVVRLIDKLDRCFPSDGPATA